MSINSVSISGGLKADPEMRYTANSQKPMARITLAVSDYRGGEEQTTWIDCTLWGKAAETVSKYCKKGSKICIYNAKIKQERWTDKTTGQGRSKHVIEGNYVELMGGKPKDSDGQPRPPAPQSQSVPAYNNDQAYGRPMDSYQDLPKNAPGGVSDFNEIPFTRFNDELNYGA